MCDAEMGLDIGIKHQIGVLMRAILLHTSVIQLHSKGSNASAMTQQCCWERFLFASCISV